MLLIVFFLLIRFLLLSLIFLVLLLIFVLLVVLLLLLLLFLFILLLLFQFKFADQFTCELDVGTRVNIVGIPAQGTAVVRDSIAKMFDGSGLVLLSRLHGLRILAVAEVVTTV